MRLIKVLSLLLIGFTVVATLSSCEEDDDNKVAKAQKCLNELTDSSSAPQIQACIDKVSGIESGPAYVIRCSAGFLMGGLTTGKLINAFDDYDNAPANEKEGVLIDQLALTDEDVANTVYGYCAKAETPGLQYIATLVRIGTLIKLNAAGGDIQTQIDNCASQAQDCNLPAIAESALALADLYCTGEAVEEQVCIDIATAEANAGGDLEQLALILLGQFQD